MTCTKLVQALKVFCENADVYSYPVIPVNCTCTYTKVILSVPLYCNSTQYVHPAGTKVNTISLCWILNTHRINLRSHTRLILDCVAYIYNDPVINPIQFHPIQSKPSCIGNKTSNPTESNPNTFNPTTFNPNTLSHNTSNPSASNPNTDCAQ